MIKLFIRPVMMKKLAAPCLPSLLKVRDHLLQRLNKLNEDYLANDNKRPHAYAQAQVEIDIKLTEVQLKIEEHSPPYDGNSSRILPEDSGQEKEK